MTSSRYLREEVISFFEVVSLFLEYYVVRWSRRRFATCNQIALVRSSNLCLPKLFKKKQGVGMCDIGFKSLLTVSVRRVELGRYIVNWYAVAYTGLINEKFPPQLFGFKFGKALEHEPL